MQNLPTQQVLVYSVYRMCFAKDGRAFGRGDPLSRASYHTLNGGQE